VALVSDGSRGIGAAVVRRLAQAGWDVGFSHRGDEQGARQAEKDASELGARVLATRADLTEAAQVTAWVRQAEEELGPVQATVVCAGLAGDQPLALLTDADWRAVTETGLSHLCRAALAAMSPRGSGHLVAVSSVFRVYRQEAPAPGHRKRRDNPVPGIASFTRALARQAARSGIRVNAVVPALAEADLTAILPGTAEVSETIAVRRFGRAADVAEMVASMLTDDGFTGRVVEQGKTVT
jgi:3-oxoacyl-[acyl-carrier protein] reductase